MGDAVKILVIDADPEAARELGKLLANRAVAIDAASTGEEGLRLLFREGYPIAVCAYELPDGSGREILDIASRRELRTSVIISGGGGGGGGEETVVECLGAGAHRFLTKPFDKTEVLRAIDSALAEAKKRPSGVFQEIDVLHSQKGWVELTVPSRYEYIERLENFLDCLSQMKLSEEDKEDLRIAINEIGSNAVEWGNKSDESRRVKVSYCFFPAEVVIKIEDEGEGFTPDAVKAPGSDPISHMSARAAEGKRAGGYGLYITRKLMDEVMYSDKGNTVILSKKLGVSRPQGARKEAD